MSRILVVQTAWLGDVVLTTPLLDALAARHGPVDVVTTPDAAPLLASHPAVRAVLAYDKHGRDRGLRALWRWAQRLREQRYRVAVLAQGSIRSGLMAWAARIPRRVGFADQPAATWCTDRRLRPDGHEAERLLALADDPAPSTPSLHLTAADHTAAQAALDAAGVTPPFVALAPGSARPSKRWPHYRALAVTLAPAGPVVVLGLPGDRLSPPVAGAADLTGLPIRVSAAVLAAATVAVANDSVALHLAQAVGTPVVALFGPTHPRLGFGPRGPRDQALGLELACRPCSTHGGRRCPRRHHRCLRALPVATVREAVVRGHALQEVPCGS